MSEFLSWAGKHLGGRADSEEIRTAYAWAGLPHVIFLGLWMILIAIYGGELFSEIKPIYESNPLPLLFSGYVGLIIFIWGMILRIICISEAHEFSIWKSILILFAPYGIMFGISWLLAQLII